VTKVDHKLWCMTGVWLALVSGALFAMADYTSEQGEVGDAPSIWPQMSSVNLETESDKPTLVLFAHPLCPCTRATLWELGSVANRLYGLFTIHVLFYRPEDSSSMPLIWAASELKNMARRLPDAQIYDDINGDMASDFGAYTSGQILLYDTDEQLQFAGGITPSRGHVGANGGSAALISAIIDDDRVNPLKTVLNPVYGCSLHEKSEGDRKIKPLVTTTKNTLPSESASL